MSNVSSNLELLAGIVEAAFAKGILAQKFKKARFGSQEWKKLDEELQKIGLTLGGLEVEYLSRFAPEALEMLDNSITNKENK